MRWDLPAGPATTVVRASPTDWGEGLPPAAVSNPWGTLIASLLGSPGHGFEQIVLYRQGRPRLARHIALPGELRLVSFAPAGTRFVTVWNAARRSTDVRHATLVDAITGQVRDLGPAVAAFWL
jgi:hypothetical protein